MKDIRTGPTAPAFLTPALLKVLEEQFGLKGTTTADADLAEIRKQIDTLNQRRLEDAALDALLLGRLRDRADWLARMDAVDADAVRSLFARMATSGAALALTGRVPRGSADRAQARLAAAGLLP